MLAKVVENALLNPINEDNAAENLTEKYQNNNPFWQTIGTCPLRNVMFFMKNAADFSVPYRYDPTLLNFRLVNKTFARSVKKNPKEFCEVCSFETETHLVQVRRHWTDRIRNSSEMFAVGSTFCNGSNAPSPTCEFPHGAVHVSGASGPANGTSADLGRWFLNSPVKL